MHARLAASPEREVLAGDGGTLRAGELALRARRVHAALRSAGVEPGDRVAVCLPKDEWLPAVHLGALAAGAIVVPLNPAYPDDALAGLVRRAAPALGLGDPDFIARMRASVPEVPWALGGEGVADASSDAEPVPRAEDDPALLVFTSGTTGTPKGVPLSHGNVASNLAALRRTWDWSADDRLLHVLPVFHLHGLGVALYGSLLAGNAMVLHERFVAERVLDEAGPQAITFLMAVPTMLHRLVDAAERRERNPLAGLRIVVSGSAPLAPALWERFRARFGLTPVERYGMSETMMNASNPAAGPCKPGSVGPPVDGVEIRLRRVEDGADAGQGPGEVQVRGPNVFAGYWNDPDATDDAFDGAWFCTGDLGRFDADGYLHLVGRSKEIIVTGGYNVAPLAVERALEAEGDARLVELAVAGVPDAELGERIVVYAVPRARYARGSAWQALEDDLRARAQQHLPRYAQPREYRACASLPRNALGKVERARLGERQGAGD